jgi:hypothetical protein
MSTRKVAPWIAAFLTAASAVTGLQVRIDAPTAVRSTEVLGRISKPIHAITEAGLAPIDEVKDERVFELPVLAAKKIVFHPGSRLVLTAEDASIVARTIQVLPGEPRPTITWKRPDEALPLPPPMGKAQPGALGAVEGADGAPGANGLAGNSGFRGRSAPSLYLVVEQVLGGSILVELRGQDGGPGGQGQTGGDGGYGRSGRNAVSSLFDCRSGGGNGGTGGRGGQGGPGGEGGKGGSGGILVLLAVPERLPALRDNFVVDGSPGNGGPGGPGGVGGAPGLPGSGGSGSGFCGGGAPGATGPPGTTGTDGPAGAPGAAGSFVAAEVTSEQFNYLIGARQ